MYHVFRSAVSVVNASVVPWGCVLAALGFVFPLSAEEAPARPSYDRYRAIVDRNLFAPLPAGAGGTAAPGAADPGHAPVLTGVVYDRRAAAWKGLIERTAQGEPLFVGVGDPTPGGTVLRVETDRLVLLAPALVAGQGEGREVEVPVGFTLAGAPSAGGGADEGAPGAGVNVLAPITDRIQDVIDRLKEKRGKSVDSAPRDGDNKGSGAADLGVDEKSKSVLERMKERYKKDKIEKDKPEKLKN
jgi:hypothetical protein